MTEWEHRTVCTNGVRLHVVQAGPRDGPLLILLHGFPEIWYGWRRQIDTLARAGYCVWAPDQRGYNLSEKPRGVSAYGMNALADDVRCLIAAAGRERACLIGHDFGAAVAWHCAETYPQYIEKLVAINVPHPNVFAKHLLTNPEQMLRSWYILFFQLPWLPEICARSRNWRMMVNALTGSSSPGTFDHGDLRHYREVWSEPGAFHAMLNWYRAAVRRLPRLLSRVRIEPPTLLLWGTQDQFLGREMAQPSIDLCREGRLVFFERATHWVHLEESERVNELILEFLNAERRSERVGVARIAKTA